MERVQIGPTYFRAGRLNTQHLLNRRVFRGIVFRPSLLTQAFASDLFFSLATRSFQRR